MCPPKKCSAGTPRCSRSSASTSENTRCGAIVARRAPGSGIVGPYVSRPPIAVQRLALSSSAQVIDRWLAATRQHQSASRSAFFLPFGALELQKCLLTRVLLSNNIVLTVKALPVTVRRIGNSLGVVIPKPVLAQVGLCGEAEMTVERGAIVLRKPRRAARTGWGEAAQSIAKLGDDEILMGEFANAADAELEW
jgi:antitoxin MazE